jgi:hypothetical protein
MLTENINTGRASTHVIPAKYEAMREAILAALPGEEPGLTYDELVDAVAPRVNEEQFPHIRSVRWYTKCVQLDLEARRLIERIPRSKPLRFRKLG